MVCWCRRRSFQLYSLGADYFADVNGFLNWSFCFLEQKVKLVHRQKCNSEGQTMNPKVQILDNGFLSIVDAVLCPQCVHDGTSSTVHTSCGFTTHTGVDMFHDLFGNFHSHDPNEMTSDWSCSLGHGGKAYSRRACHNLSCKLWNGYLEYVADPSKYPLEKQQASGEYASTDEKVAVPSSPDADQPRDTNIILWLYFRNIWSKLLWHLQRWPNY